MINTKEEKEVFLSYLLLMKSFEQELQESSQKIVEYTQKIEHSITDLDTDLETRTKFLLERLKSQKSMCDKFFSGISEFEGIFNLSEDD